MEFRKAKIEDIDDIMEMVSNCIIEMNKNNIFCWGEFYPTKEIILNDIKESIGYVGYKNNSILSYVAFYKEPIWDFIDKDTYLLDSNFPVRIMTNPLIHQKGYGRKLISFIESLGEKNYIKILAHETNYIALSFYKKCGYTIVETFDSPYGEKMILLERKIK